MRLLDAIELSSPYASGIFSAFKSLGQNECRFSFFGPQHWYLKVKKL
jgi:hypothetical protein